jgi:glyoxylase-like metal-dependent hydrolase (beta-lactamase superfamily II)
MPVRNTVHIGDVRLTLVEELVMPTSARWMLPDHPAPFEVLEAARPWLEPHMLNERGHILQSIHSWVIEADGMRIVVDTGIGNDKDRESGGFEGWHMRQGPYLDDLAEAGVPAGSVDVVLNTHMHGDHAGWNARWVDGAWVPTFEHARYQLVEREWRYWSEAADPTPDIIEDSVRPVVEAGAVDLVPADHRVSDSVWLEPSHGHTPGHVCVRIASGGQEAVIIGDVMHSPIQCAVPEQRPALDRFVEEARAARLALLERYADTDVVVLGTHFHQPATGYFRRDGAAYRYDVFEGDPPRG